MSERTDVRAGDGPAASADRYRLLFESLADPVFVVDQADGRILEVTPAAAPVYGYPRAELIGRAITELSADPAQGLADLRQGRLGAALRLHERRDRTRFPVEVIASVVEWDGRPAVIQIVRDVTERVRAEEALRESKALVEAVVDNVPLMIFLKEATDLRFVLFNRAGEELVGYDRSTFLGRNNLDLFPPEQAAHFQAKDREVLDGAAGFLDIPEEAISTAKQGLRVLHTRKVCIRGADGTTKYLLGVSEDITERKRLQAGLAQSDRLSSMGMLAAGVAHEINNPLAYVLANVEGVARDLAALAGAAPAEPAALGDLAARVERALEGLHRIRKISRSLRTFSRVERVDLEQVDLNAAVDAAVTMARNEVKFRARLEVTLGELPPVLASEGKLSQVFLNLVLNAAHAIPEGRADANRIGLRTWADGPDVFAEVVDTGHGIPPEDLERIFEPFFTTKQVGAGSGLGLAISRTIVTEFGGDLRVESAAGQGARFLVRLPACAAPGRRDARAPPAEPSAAPVRGRVLVVDDEWPIRQVLERLLGRQHEVVTAASGREGQRLLERDRAFDLILCDLMMPEMTGMDLHAWLVAQGSSLAGRVVFMSGGAFTPKASDYMAGLGNPQLEKPFDQAALQALVARLVAEARGGAG